MNDKYGALDNAARRYVLVGDKDNAGIYNNAVWNEDNSKMVAELMGHKNIEVTHKYYTQYAIEKRKEVMQNFDITGNR